MNMNQLKYVLTVANSSSLREAAMKLYISQPALSLSISELENELGIVLFERSNRGIGLTDAGREFITYAKKVLGQYEILEDRYLSRKDAILQGLVSIKLKEEDPLTIGYITRKGSSLSRYGEAYIEELLKYRETM